MLRFFLALPTTRSENDGHNSLPFRNSSSAITGCSAKTCSGMSNFISTPTSTARDSTPDITIPASEHARIMNSKLFPVFTEAKIKIPTTPRYTMPSRVSL